MGANIVRAKININQAKNKIKIKINEGFKYFKISHVTFQSRIL